MATRLTALRLPAELLSEIDSFVGPGKRSEFIVKAVEKSLLQLKQEKALKESHGAWSDRDYAEFATPEDVESWVRRLRESAEERLNRPLEKD